MHLEIGSYGAGIGSVFRFTRHSRRRGTKASSLSVLISAKISIFENIVPETITVSEVECMDCIKNLKWNHREEGDVRAMYLFRHETVCSFPTIGPTNLRPSWRFFEHFPRSLTKLHVWLARTIHFRRNIGTVAVSLPISISRQNLENGNAKYILFGDRPASASRATVLLSGVWSLDCDLLSAIWLRMAHALTTVVTTPTSRTNARKDPLPSDNATKCMLGYLEVLGILRIHNRVLFRRVATHYDSVQRNAGAKIGFVYLRD